MTISVEELAALICEIEVEDPIDYGDLPYDEDDLRRRTRGGKPDDGAARRRRQAGAGESGPERQARVCSQSSQPDERTREMNERQERRSEFVVSRSDASELLETAEETLDQIPIPVEMSVERARIEAIGARRDNRLSALCFDDCHKRVGVVALVGDDITSRLVLDQRSGLVDVCDLSGRQNDAQRIAECIDGNMQLGGQSASRPADFLTAGFFWAPAEC